MHKSKRDLLIVLIVFPLIYFMYSLSPWSKELFVKGNDDLFIPFWSGIIILHWLSVFIIKIFLNQENKTFRDIGFMLNAKKNLILVISYFTFSLFVFGFTEQFLQHISIDEKILSGLLNFFPKTTSQRLLFILTVFSAGFCEEIIYRGYAITKLTELKMNKWAALIPAGIAFVFTHGIVTVTGLGQFFFYFIPALIFGSIFIWRKRLLFNIVIHLLFDLTAMTAIFQAIKY
ncbi:MAG: hypothetical protein CSB55_06895 [Candidatus Cloacimonadota bacterium]|nr:MAG: hypothetical protein CSB55_06895 [Candidatus Cloacimonadota bacterium]